jgi:predicted enzyme related to lactoylglutathione lyase
MKPSYFDFTVKDLDEAKSFFEHVFDWRLEKFPGMPYDYNH